MIGDLLFCRPGPMKGLWGDWSGNLIARLTNGPFCHVEIDVGYGKSVGAMGDGIREHSAPGGAAAWSARFANLNEEQIEAGISWVRSQVGDVYGYSDLIDNLLKQAKVPLVIKQLKAYDCSDFASQYLIKTGYDIGPLQDNPAAVSPNDLARQLGMI